VDVPGSADSPVKQVNSDVYRLSKRNDSLEVIPVPTAEPKLQILPDASEVKDSGVDATVTDQK
jgi:hypothetical protein